MHNQPDSIQFSVTRITQNVYRIVVQDQKETIRSYLSDVAKITDDLGHELEQLQSRPV